MKYVSLQKKETKIFWAQDNVIYISRKLQCLSSQVDYYNFDCFPTLPEYQLESEVGLPAETVGDINLLRIISRAYLHLSMNISSTW